MKDQFAHAQAQLKTQYRHSTINSSTSASATSATSIKPASLPSEENILAVSPPSELQLSELEPSQTIKVVRVSRSSSESSTNLGVSRHSSSSSVDRTAAQSILLKRAAVPAAWLNNSLSPSERSTPVHRSNTVSTWSPSRLPTSTTPRLGSVARQASEAMTASTSSILSTSNTASRSRGVQMVSEMRARVRNLEQKLHTRVPRIRMGSISGKKAESTASSVVNGLAMTTTENPKTTLKKRSVDLENEKKTTSSKSKSSDTSGWVLIMEDSMSPTPTKDREKERRRLSSPSASPFSRSAIPKSSSMQLTDANLGKSGIRRPQSRLSGDGRDSMSTVSTTSSIPTPTSRPATPTFLPVPTGGPYGSGLSALKRSTGPGQKRSSLGSTISSSASGTFLQPPKERPLSALASTNKNLPVPPNVNVRTRAPSALGQSRIVRPNSFSTGRKSVGAEEGNNLSAAVKDLSRSRAGSTAATGRRVF